jgi:hypothetical protein
MPGQSRLDEERCGVYELVFQDREFLTELIVKLARDGRAFLLAREPDPRRQSPKLRFGGMRLVVVRIPR